MVTAATIDAGVSLEVATDASALDAEKGAVARAGTRTDAALEGACVRVQTAALSPGATVICQVATAPLLAGQVSRDSQLLAQEEATLAAAPPVDAPRALRAVAAAEFQLECDLFQSWKAECARSPVYGLAEQTEHLVYKIQNSENGHCAALRRYPTYPNECPPP
jgi:hypothetical protein